MIVSQIAAISENHALGKDNKLLWHYPEDLKYFKSQTLNKVIIMGRKTFESFGGKPLPKRIHIVLSRSADHFQNSDVVFYVKTIDDAFKLASFQIETKNLSPEIMVIGGAEIYKQTLPYCQTLYITKVSGHYEADAFYPEDYLQQFVLEQSQLSTTTPGLEYQVWKKR